MHSKKTTLLLIRILEKIVSDNDLHGRFLNTLSLLEYIGTRKIVKSLPSHLLNETFLEHINEESRHSLFFKKLAKKVSNKTLSFNNHEMLIPKEAEKYFQTIDKSAESLSQNNILLNYFYTTYIVESRATFVYSIYNKILKRENFPFTLNSLLKEEEKHLDFVTNSIAQKDPFAQQNCEELKELEHQAYFSFLIQLEGEVFNSSSKIKNLYKPQNNLSSQETHL